MNWTEKLLPIITLILGWGLAQYGKFWIDKKIDRRKIKKLLFNLLELRWLLKKELDLNNDIIFFINKLYPYYLFLIIDNDYEDSDSYHEEYCNCYAIIAPINDVGGIIKHLKTITDKCLCDLYIELCNLYVAIHLGGV